MKTRVGAQARGGFTVIEVLLAVTLASIVLGVTFGIYSAGMVREGKESRNLADLAAVLVVVAHLEADIQRSTGGDANDTHSLKLPASAYRFDAARGLVLRNGTPIRTTRLADARFAMGSADGRSWLELEVEVHEGRVYRHRIAFPGGGDGELARIWNCNARV